MIHEFLPQLVQVFLRVMLAGQNHRCKTHGDIEVVLHRHLRLAVRTQALDHPGFSGVGQQPGEPVGQDDRQRKIGFCLITGKAIHDPLVASPSLDSFPHSVSNIVALIVGDDLDLIVQPSVPSFPDGPADNGGDIRHDLCRDFSGHQHFASCGQYFAGHMGGGVTLETGIQNRIRDGVAELVRVALGNRLCGQNVFISHGRFSLSFLCVGRQRSVPVLRLPFAQEGSACCRTGTCIAESAHPSGK